MKEVVTCYAWGREGDWEALCIDLDLAVHGRSFEEVRSEMQDAIDTYVSYVAELPEPERTRLLNRRVPLVIRLGLECRFMAYSLLNRLRIRIASFYTFQPTVVWNSA